MTNVPDESASVLTGLARRIADLEHRVLALEKTAPAIPFVPESSLQELQSQQPSSVALPTGMISTLGRAVLGIAVAYLFRAASESAILPRSFLVIAAMLYAAFWLVSSVRLRAFDGFARAVYALTAVLIFSPLLWEATIRFRILSPAFAACALAVFMTFGFALSLRFDLQAAPWILALFALPTAVALVVGTGAVTPFVISLLAIGLTVEIAGCRDKWSYLRPIVAAAADFMIWLMTYLLARPEGPPSGYIPADKSTLVILPLGLFVIYATSTAYRTIVRRLPITVFEIVQLPVSLILATTGVMAATLGGAIRGLGIFILVLAAACYVATFTRFRQEGQSRNFYLFSTYAAAFLLTGIWLLVPQETLTAFFCAAAVLTMIFGATKKISILHYHASVYLLGAFLAAGFFPLAVRAFVGANPGTTNLTNWLAILTALICYMTIWKFEVRGWQHHLGAFFQLSIAAIALASSGVILFFGLAAKWKAPEADSLAVIRTALICASAIVFALLASRYKRIEFVWAAYGALAIGTVKIILEDLRLERKGWLAISI